MIPPSTATIIVKELIRLNEANCTKALFAELTRRSKRIEEIYAAELTDESYAEALSEQHLIDAFKLYHRVMTAKVTVLEKGMMGMVLHARSQMEVPLPKWNKDATYSDLKWQSDIIKRLRKL
jgi:hypothetical protein